MRDSTVAAIVLAVMAIALTGVSEEVAFFVLLAAFAVLVGAAIVDDSDQRSGRSDARYRNRR